MFRSISETDISTKRYGKYVLNQTELPAGYTTGQKGDSKG